MSHDKQFWDDYVSENESRYNPEFAVFVRNLATSLHCSSILEVGCGTGIDLRLFADTPHKAYGLDTNEKALSIADKNTPTATFERGSITDIPFRDSEMDFVFTHGLLNYLDDDTLKAGVAEMHRVAGKYIMNCERFKEDEVPIDNHRRFRNMRKWWSGYNVRLVSNVDMHPDIEPEESRFTLLKKL